MLDWIVATPAAQGFAVLKVWLPLFAIAIITGWWFRALRLRERVTAHARRLCERHGVQLLDDSVALHRLRVSWRRGALHVLREYRFETSTGGNDRRGASLLLVGDHIASTNMPAAAAPAPTVQVSFRIPYGAPTPDAAPGGNNVIPIERARRPLQ